MLGIPQRIICKIYIYRVIYTQCRGLRALDVCVLRARQLIGMVAGRWNLIWGCENGPGILGIWGGHINSAARAIEVDVVAATRLWPYANALSVMSYGSRQLFR